MSGIELNYLAILVSAAATIALGMLWYSALFGKQWIALMGWTEEQMKQAKQKSMGKSYALMMATALVKAYVLAMIVGFSGSATLATGLLTGFWVWLGFVATVSMGSVLWEGKSWKLYVLNNGYDLVSLLVMGGVLAVWR
ncbi:MAG: DUF1761 domain-containing protein [Patescibacteria group bacterium]